MQTARHHEQFMGPLQKKFFGTMNLKYPSLSGGVSQGLIDAGIEILSHIKKIAEWLKRDYAFLLPAAGLKN